ncbi:MAG: hypothetical protein AB7P07_09250 [Hyphomonadaceae bacterium]
MKEYAPRHFGKRSWSGLAILMIGAALAIGPARAQGPILPSALCLVAAAALMTAPWSTLRSVVAGYWLTIGAGALYLGVLLADGDNAAALEFLAPAAAFLAGALTVRNSADRRTASLVLVGVTVLVAVMAMRWTLTDDRAYAAIRLGGEAPAAVIFSTMALVLTARLLRAAQRPGARMGKQVPRQLRRAAPIFGAPITAAVAAMALGCALAFGAARGWIAAGAGILAFAALLAISQQSLRPPASRLAAAGVAAALLGLGLFSEVAWAASLRDFESIRALAVRALSVEVIESALLALMLAPLLFHAAHDALKRRSRREWGAAAFAVGLMGVCLWFAQKGALAPSMAALMSFILAAYTPIRFRKAAAQPMRSRPRAHRSRAQPR